MYLFKHALVQDAALWHASSRAETRAARQIADAIEEKVPTVADKPAGDPLARRCPEAGRIVKAASLWGKAGQRSLGSAAFPEAERQLTRARSLKSASLPGAPLLRREQIKLQVGLLIRTDADQGLWSVRDQGRVRTSASAYPAGRGAGVSQDP